MIVIHEQKQEQTEHWKKTKTREELRIGKTKAREEQRIGTQQKQ